MNQIDLKDYPSRFAMCGLPIIKVGINFDFGVKLFQNFSFQRLLRGFSWLHFAAGKLPLPFKFSITSGSCKNLFFISNNCCNNSYRISYLLAHSKNILSLCRIDCCSRHLCLLLLCQFPCGEQNFLLFPYSSGPLSSLSNSERRYRELILFSPMRSL